MSKSYSPAEKEKGMIALAEAGGNARKAEEATQIPRSTLSQWKVKDAEQYERIRAEVLPKIFAEVASEWVNVIRKQSHAEDELTDRVRETVGDLKPGEAHGALRNMAVAKGVLIDKLRLVTDQPTQIVEHRDVGEILRSWKERGWVESTPFDVESTATEEKQIEEGKDEREENDE